ncbi:hypothetical protein N7510_000550 [Penicillium lagena]|uniref:uncharacterized protein n=1 Tax=Penicillium lagena TaxID=94218 RepID=UPI00253F716D|nr:uncharacterized protein N7510_000550 [Penicillium lagena]KAJ5624241.1 hypothetical protein N7510_000550 [Penicillium lagena]
MPDLRSPAHPQPRISFRWCAALGPAEIPCTDLPAPGYIHLIRDGECVTSTEKGSKRHRLGSSIDGKSPDPDDRRILSLSKLTVTPSCHRPCQAPNWNRDPCWIRCLCHTITSHRPGSLGVNILSSTNLRGAAADPQSSGGLKPLASLA